MRQPCLPRPHLEPRRRPAIPAKQNEIEVAYPLWIYHNRNRVERLWEQLKKWCAFATRYGKTTRSFVGVLCMAATIGMDQIAKQNSGN